MEPELKGVFYVGLFFRPVVVDRGRADASYLLLHFTDPLILISGFL